MSAYITRDLKITWGTFECGGSTDREIHGFYELEVSGDAFGFSFDCIVQAQSHADFVAACNAFEAEFRKRDQRLKIEIGSSTYRDFNPASTSEATQAFNTAAAVSKPGTPGADTGYSRLYRVTLGGELPPPDGDGRRDARIRVDYDESRRRTVTITGTYTRLGGNSASEQYAAEITAYANSILSGIDGAATFEGPTNEVEDRDRLDNTIDFVRVFTERLANQAIGSLDHANVTEEQLVIRQIKPSPGDSAEGIQRIRDFDIIFSCAVNRENTTDLESVWESTILPWLKEAFEAEVNPSQWGITNEEHLANESANRIDARLSIRALVDATDVLQSTTSSAWDEAYPVAVTAPWDGDPETAHLDEPAYAPRFKRYTRQAIVAGQIGPSSRIPGGQGGDLVGASFSGGGEVGTVGLKGGKGNTQSGFFDSLTQAGRERAQGSSGKTIVLNRSRATPIRIGDDEQGFWVTHIDEEVVEQHAKRPGRGGGIVGARFSGGSN